MSGRWGRAGLVAALFMLPVPAVLPASASVGMDEDLRLRYSFNEGGGGVVTDSSGWLRHAAITGQVDWVRQDGTGLALFGNSLRLGDGQVGSQPAWHGHLRLDGPDPLRLRESALSVSVWLNPDPAGAGTARTLVSLGDEGPGGFSLRLDGEGRLVAEAWPGAGSAPQQVISAPLLHGQWAHAVAVLDEDGLRLFVLPAGSHHHLRTDGPSPPGVALAGTALPLVIGAGPQGLGEHYPGLLDELRIYGRGLADEEVAGLGNRVGGEPGLVFYEPFDDGSTVLANEGVLTGGSFVSGRFDRAMALPLGTVSFPVIDSAGNTHLDLRRGAVTFLYRPDWPAGSLNHRLFMTDNFCTGGNLLAVNAYQGSLNLTYGGNGASASGSTVTTRAVEPAGVASWTNDQWYPVEIAWDMTTGAGERYAVVAVNGNQFNFSYIDEVPSGLAPDRFVIGRICGASWPFNGAIDELKIYDRPTFDVADTVAEYIRRSRGNGIVEDHETIHNSPDPQPAAQPGTGISFFLKPAFTAIFGNYLPQPDELLSGPAHFTAAGNSHETLFINAHAHTAPGRVEVSLAGGSLRQGEAELADVRVLAVRNWWQGSRPESRRVSRLPYYVPELLVNDDTVITNHSARPDPDHAYRAIDFDGQFTARLPSFDSGSPTRAIVDFQPQTSRQFAIVVKVPPGVSGMYTGTLEIRDPANGEALLASQPVSLEVLDIELADSDKELLIYHRGVDDPESCLPPGSTAGLGACRSLLADTGTLSGTERYWLEVDDIVAHGFNGVFTYRDMASQAQADAYVMNLARSGLNNRLIFTDSYPLGGPGSNSIYSPYPRLAVESARAAGYLRAGATFATRDEPGYRSARNQTNVIGWHLGNVADLHAVGAEAITSLYYDVELCLRDGGAEAAPAGVGCTGDALARLNEIFPGPLPPLEPRLGSSPWPVGSYPQLDIASLYLEDRHPSSSAPAYFDSLLNGGASTSGRREVVYWHPNREDPRINRFVAGTFLFLSGVDGLFPYAYNDVNEQTDPFNDFDLPPGATSALEQMTSYPSADGPVTTMQWEALREGLDDYRYLRAWQQLATLVARNGRVDATLSAEVLELHLVKHRGALADGLDGVPGYLDVDDFVDLRAAVVSEIVRLRSIDTDGDGIPDYQDNCLLAANPEQRDADGDGIGNACDADFNQDGTVNFADLSTFRSRFGTTDAAADLNGDGVVNFADLALFMQLFGSVPGPSALAP